MQGFLAAILKKKKESFFFPLGDLCSLVRVDRACEGRGGGGGREEEREGKEEKNRKEARRRRKWRVCLSDQNWSFWKLKRTAAS